MPRQFCRELSDLGLQFHSRVRHEQVRCSGRTCDLEPLHVVATPLRKSIFRFVVHAANLGASRKLDRGHPCKKIGLKASSVASLQNLRRKPTHRDPIEPPQSAHLPFISNLRSARPAQPACSKRQRLLQPASCGCLAPLRLSPEPPQRHFAGTVFQRGDQCRLRRHRTSVQMPQPASQQAPPSTLPPLQPQQACYFRQLRAQMVAAVQPTPLPLNHVLTQRCFVQRFLLRRRQSSSGAVFLSARSVESSSSKRRSEQRNRSSPSARRVSYTHGVCAC